MKLNLGFQKTQQENESRISKEIDAKKRMEKLNEASVQIKGHDKPSGAFVLSTVILDELEVKGLIKISNKRDKKNAIDIIQDVIMNSTF